MTAHTAKPGRGAVFFDRDGVLNVNTGYLHRAEDWRWIEGAPEAIAAVQKAGLLAIVVTNQSGVARGLYGEAAIHSLHAFVDTDLQGRGLGPITAYYHCPYHSEGSVAAYIHPDHPDRKPNPGMILRAIQEHDLDPRRCLLVGDQPSDIEAARRAGLPGLLYAGGRLDDLLRPHLDGLVTADQTL